MKVGFFADAHIRETSVPSICTAFKNSITHLFETVGVEILVFGGDNVTFTTNAYDIPHCSQASVEKFWELVDETGYGEQCVAVPGNHECPVPLWMKHSGTRGVAPRKISYTGTKAVDLLLVNSSGNTAQGGGMGSGWSYGNIPYSDLKWLSEQLVASAAAGNIRLVMAHHHLYFTFDTSAGHNIDSGNIYKVCLNAPGIKAVLDASAPVIVAQGHTKPTSEGFTLISNVYYTYQKHWSDAVELKTISYFDINQTSGNVKMITIDNDLSTENEILNVTPAW